MHRFSIWVSDETYTRLGRIAAVERRALADQAAVILEAAVTEQDANDEREHERRAMASA
jgi:hypothetical protein